MSRRSAGITRAGLLLGLFLALALRVGANPHLRTGGDQNNQALFSNLRFHIGDHLNGEALVPLGASVTPFVVSCQGFDVATTDDIRIIIPAPLPLTWDTSVLPTFSTVVAGPLLQPLTGSVTAAGSANTTYPDAGPEKTLFIEVATGFSPGNNFIVSNLRVNNIVSSAAPTHNQMYTTAGQLSPGWEDEGFWMVAQNPDTVSFPQQQVLAPGTNNITLDDLTIRETQIDSTPFNGAIWNDKDIRITIPASVIGVTWSTGAITTAGTAHPNAKIGASVTTEDGGRTVVIPVVDGSANDFTVGEFATIRGLRLNVTAAAPDQTFSLSVRLGGASNWTSHFPLPSVCKVEGWPKLATAGVGLSPNVFTMGAAATPTGTFTITESSGAGPTSRKMVNGVNLDVTIPNSLNLQWGAVPAASIGAGAPGASVGVISIQPGNKILRIPVTGDFSADQVLTLTGAQFANFSGQNLTNQFLELELNAPHAGPEAFDSRAVRIGRPSLSSTNDDVFLIGGATGTLNDIIIKDDLVNAVLANNTQIRIHISSGSNLSFTGVIPTVTGGLAGGAVSFADANKTMVVTWTSAPAAGATGTIVAAPVSWPASASFGNLELWMAPVGSTLLTNTSPQSLIVGNLPNLASTQTQQFTVNDPDPTAHPLTITTDPGSFQLFQMGNSLQLIIPSALNLEWKNPQPGGFGMSGSAFTNGRMTGAINYPDPKTLEFPINLDWASGEVLTFTGLQFTNVSAVSPPTGLQMRVRSSGPIAGTDTLAKAIGAPVLASGANQVFGNTDLATTMSPIRITDHAVTPRILGTKNLRIRIPALFNMTWDPTSTPLLTLGPGTGTLNGAPSFTDANKVLTIPILTSFSAGQTLDITGARFLVSGTSGLSRLELEVNESGVANVLDTRTILIGIRPQVTSVTTADTTGNGSIDRLIVTFNEDMNPTGSLSISAGLGFAFGTYGISSGSLDVTQRIVTFVLAETGLPDTDAFPPLVYTATGPLGGDLADADDGLELTAAIPATQDKAAPVIVGISVIDSNGDGRPDQVVLRFSETITGTPLISRWTLIDANGTTDLLAGLTDSALQITGATSNAIQIDLSGAAGTLGTPRFQYRSTGPGAVLTDGAGNLVPTSTNNNAPIANAGNNITAAPSRVTLDGSGSFDPDGQPLLYDWTYQGGPVLLPQLNFLGASTAKPTFLATAAGTYTFQLKVSDILTFAVDTVAVTVLNVAPVANAGPDLTVLNTGGGNTPLNALLSADPNGDTLTYQWTVIAGPAFIGSTTALPVVTGFFSIDGLYQLELKVTDSSALQSTDTMWLRVNSPGNNVPTADAGPDQVVTAGNLVTLDGRNSSDTEAGALTYAWTSTVPLDTTNPDRPTFTPAGPGLYTFTLTVTDAGGQPSIPDTVTVLAYNPSNLPPVAVANKLTLGTPAAGQTVTLDATGSLDPEGKPLQYAWSQRRGATVVLSDSSGPQPTFTATQPGTYEFSLTVGDGVQFSFPSIVSFGITALPGGAVPSTTTTLTAPGTVGGGHVINSPTLMQLGSTAAGTTHVVWTQEAGPSVAFDAAPAATSFTPGAGKRGVYRFNRTGWNAEGVVTTTPLVIVMDDDNTEVAPTAKAGTDQTVTAGELVTLDGGLSSDNSPTPTLRPYWIQIVGAPVALTQAATLTPSFRPTTPGVYLFALKVSDGVGDSLTDFVQITVDPAPVSKSSGGGGGGGCGSVGVDALILVGLAAVGWRRRRP